MTPRELYEADRRDGPLWYWGMLWPGPSTPDEMERVLAIEFPDRHATVKRREQRRRRKIRWHLAHHQRVENLESEQLWLRKEITSLRRTLDLFRRENEKLRGEITWLRGPTL